MRRTVLSAMALACTAVLAGGVPAFADDAKPVPAERAATPTASESVTPDEKRSAVPVPREERDRGQVSDVPRGAPDTGEVPASDGSGNAGALIGGGAAAALAAGGATFLVVRRRRATGA